MNRIAAALLGCAAALAACQSVSTRPNPMSRIVASWEGKPIDAATRHWGPPTRQAAQGGRTVYEWQTSNSLFVPSVGIDARHGQWFELQCVRRLVADERGIVTGSAWQGDLCCGGSAAVSCLAWQNPDRT